MSGRPQLSSRTGPTYQLAEFLNENWDKMVGRTNDDVATELGYRAANLISMWRTGKTRVPLEKLPDVARLMKIDLAALLPLWFEQAWGDRDDCNRVMEAFSARVTTDHEAPLLHAVRTATKMRDPYWSPDQIEAVAQVLSDPDVMISALDAAAAKRLAIAV